MRITPPLSVAERDALVRHALARGVSGAASDFELSPETFRKISQGYQPVVATLALIRSHFRRLGIKVPTFGVVVDLHPRVRP